MGRLSQGLPVHPANWLRRCALCAGAWEYNPTAPDSNRLGNMWHFYGLPGGDGGPGGNGGHNSEWTWGVKLVVAWYDRQ
jgi:hypothetical protein